MEIDACVKGMEKGELEAFSEMEKFLERFNGGDLNNFKDTAIPKCVSFFLRFYSQEHTNQNLQLAYSSFKQGSKERALLYLEKAGFYLQKSRSNSR